MVRERVQLEKFIAHVSVDREYKGPAGIASIAIILSRPSGTRCDVSKCEMLQAGDEARAIANLAIVSLCEDLAAVEVESLQNLHDGTRASGSGRMHTSGLGGHDHCLANREQEHARACS